MSRAPKILEFWAIVDVIAWGRRVNAPKERILECLICIEGSRRYPIEEDSNIAEFVGKPLTGVAREH